MIPNLSPDEESYLKELVGNQTRGIRSLHVTANLLLVFGGLLVVGAALYVAEQMTDTAAYSVGLPNFIGGMISIAGYIFLSRRVTQMKKLTSLLTKLSAR
jgi:hypothetical protein